MSIKKARKTLQNKEKFNYDILDKVANSGENLEPVPGNIIDDITKGYGFFPCDSR